MRVRVFRACAVWFVRIEFWSVRIVWKMNWNVCEYIEWAATLSFIWAGSRGGEIYRSSDRKPICHLQLSRLWNDSSCMCYKAIFYNIFLSLGLNSWYYPVSHAWKYTTNPIGRNWKMAIPEYTKWCSMPFRERDYWGCATSMRHNRIISRERIGPFRICAHLYNYGKGGVEASIEISTLATI